MPAPVDALATGRSVHLVWENEVGGLTFEVGVDPDWCFVKWAPTESGIDLAEEAARLTWAVTFAHVPKVLDHGADDAGSWIFTTALPGEDAIANRWTAEPRTAVTAIGEGLRAQHEALPVRQCPFSWTAEDRVIDAQQRAIEGRIDPAQWHPIHRSLALGRALELLSDVPAIERSVVCHGDSCARRTH